MLSLIYNILYGTRAEWPLRNRKEHEMKEYMPGQAGWTDRGSRIATTLDRAFDDPTPGLESLRDLDAEGYKPATRVPAELELTALWEMYAEMRERLSRFGAELNATDYFRRPKTAREARETEVTRAA
jgi:hypothetical protein